MTNIAKTPSVIRMGREQLATLLTPVNETLATDAAHFKAAERRPFTSVQLWNIRRKARYNGIVIR